MRRAKCFEKSEVSEEANELAEVIEMWCGRMKIKAVWS